MFSSRVTRKSAEDCAEILNLPVPLPLLDYAILHEETLIDAQMYAEMTGLPIGRRWIHHRFHLSPFPSIQGADQGHAFVANSGTSTDRSVLVE